MDYSIGPAPDPRARSSSLQITFAAGQSESLSFFVRDTTNSQNCLFSEVSCETDQVEVLVDVVHDLGLEEGLSGVVHDLVAQLGLGDVLTELFDTGAERRGTVLVNDFVALPLGSLK